MLTFSAELILASLYRKFNDVYVDPFLGKARNTRT
jgi:hypothetical protein